MPRLLTNVIYFIYSKRYNILTNRNYSDSNHGITLQFSSRSEMQIIFILLAYDAVLPRFRRRLTIWYVIINFGKEANRFYKCRWLKYFQIICMGSRISVTNVRKNNDTLYFIHVSAVQLEVTGCDIGECLLTKTLGASSENKFCCGEIFFSFVLHI